MKKIFFKLCAVIFLFTLFFTQSLLGEDVYTIDDKLSLIDEYIFKQKKKGKIPGIAAVIIKGDEVVFQKNYGYADLEEGIPVTGDTLFEIGSLTKAFTGLGVLLLEQKGLFKPDDLITKYIPWLKMKYGDRYVDVTIAQIMHHTSGIPVESINNIHEADDDKALERTVRTLVDINLENKPGQKFLYATINYDILGLLIEYLSGQSYEDFIAREILKPLGLNSTYVYRDKAYADPRMSVGYKINFLKPRPYDAPTYRGNTPAGYVISNILDYTRWIKIQMKLVEIPENFYALIDKAHSPDMSVNPHHDDYAFYGAGWLFLPTGKGVYANQGRNPNFCGSVIFEPEYGIGVGVLTNLNSDIVDWLSRDLMNIIKEKKIAGVREDSLVQIGQLNFLVVVVSILLVLTILAFTIKLIKDIVTKQAVCVKMNFKKIISIFFMLAFIGYVCFCLYIFPQTLFYDLKWEAAYVWAPSSMIFSLASLLIVIVLFCIYFLLLFYFPKKNDRPYFPLIILSVVSGFGNALIIFTINRVFTEYNSKIASKGSDYIPTLEYELLSFLVLGIILYVLGQRLIRTRIVKITNEYIYEKRIKLVRNILDSSYFKIQKLKDGKIHAGLNNDTERISNAPNIIIGSISAVVTLILCFTYLGVINIFGLLLSLGIIVIAAGLYFFVGQRANKLWEQTREIQNTFFKFISDLISGFKELSMNVKKRRDFENDMGSVCKEYRDKNTDASIKFANVFVVGELVFTLVIAAVAFIFPIIFKEIQPNLLRNYIFIFLFMTGPINYVLNNIPQILQMRISWKRINDIIKETAGMKIDKQNVLANANVDQNVELRLEDIEYEYVLEDKRFCLGPINYRFNSGEITFITGGNGSGKTTLALIMAGLYKPDRGHLYINGKEFDYMEIGELYSNVFSDFHLFKKLYGIDYEEQKDNVKKYLELLQIDDKIDVEDGEFSSTDLSNGQKKRLALLVSYLEDKPIFIFDEWAADQDPRFRKFFYNELLQGLKEKNKCIIAITHDDHYFHIADNIIKLDMGQIDK